MNVVLVASVTSSCRKSYNSSICLYLIGFVDNDSSNLLSQVISLNNTISSETILTFSIWSRVESLYRAFVNGDLCMQPTVDHLRRVIFFFRSFIGSLAGGFILDTTGFRLGTFILGTVLLLPVMCHSFLNTFW